MRSVEPKESDTELGKRNRRGLIKANHKIKPSREYSKQMSTGRQLETYKINRMT